MTTIRLHNTLSRSKEDFAPIDPQNVRMYLCGPTVYDRAHLGNARPVLVFDVLQRLLRHVYGADAVTYVRNFTDVDDKINATALARKEAGAAGTLEELVRERSDETIGWYHADMDALGAARPDHEPRATEWISQMVDMIAGLVEKGHAYAAEGHVLFAVDSYKEYGRLSGRSVDDMIAGSRVEVAPYKRNPMDFVLWKPSTDELPGWDSPWGRGRPGWHIECSAMAFELLGAEFDIHGGGNDLQFPHHENEIAQSRCMGHGFANVWLHNEMLQVEGKKMSKSLGNFFTVRDLLDQGVPGEVIRFVMLSTHYRKPMDWTEKKRVEAEKALKKWNSLDSVPSSTLFNGEPTPEFLDALKNDLNISGAIALLHEYYSQGQYEKLVNSARFIGIPAGDFQMFQKFSVRDLQYLSRVSKIGSLEIHLHNLRLTAMEKKDFSEVDKMKAALLSAGVEVRMTAERVEMKLLPLDSIDDVYRKAGQAGLRGEIDEQEYWIDIGSKMGSNEIPHAGSQDSWLMDIAKDFLS